MDQRRLRENLLSVTGRIGDAARRAGRSPEGVTLVAVTKRCPEAWAGALVDLGQRDLGENYPQELWRKSEALRGRGIRWHLIGHLQGNKARRTAGMVSWIHGVDSLKLLESLDDIAGSLEEPPKVCLQVNTSREPSKHGWSPEGLLADAGRIAALRRIPVVGLMTMAALGTDAETARPMFARLRGLRDELRDATGLALEHLSMGMSGDFEAAVEEGATLVRVGSALFEGLDDPGGS